MSMNVQNGLVNLASKHSVEETMRRFEALLSERGITIFARVDQSGEAAKVGLAMRRQSRSFLAVRRAELR